MIKYVLGLAALTVVLWLANGVRIIGAVSKGEPIGQRPGAALLLVDLQTVFWDDGPYTDDEKSLTKAAILKEIAEMKAAGGEVIAVRQEWSIPSTRAVAWLTMAGQAVEGRQGNEIAAPFQGLADHVLVKRVQDSFETGDLDDLLERLDVGRLRIAGLDLNYCVGKTALAARARGYDVTIIDRAALAAAESGKMRDRLTDQNVRFE